MNKIPDESGFKDYDAEIFLIFATVPQNSGDHSPSDTASPNKRRQYLATPLS